MKIKSVLALVALLLVFLLAMAPARLLGLLVPAELLVLQGFGGTIWHGTATKCLVPVGHGFIHLGSVQWRLSPLSLLLGSPELQLDSRWGSQTVKGTVTLHSQSSIEARDLDVNLSARLLRQFTPVLLDGRFSLQLSRLSVENGVPVTVQGRLVWHDALWMAPQGPISLGTYALDLVEVEFPGFVGEVVTLAGPTQASGDIRLQERQYGIDLLLSNERGLDDRLQQALSLIGEQGSEGYRIRMDGEI